jgi:hypothetical protein
MKYTLIMNRGKVMQFYILSVAELYQSIYGGVIITESILENQYEQCNV